MELSPITAQGLGFFPVKRLRFGFQALVLPLVHSPQQRTAFPAPGNLKDPMVLMTVKRNAGRSANLRDGIKLRG